MIHKGRSFPILAPLLLQVLALFSLEVRAERRAIVVTEASTSGKLVRITIGARQGLTLGEAVLFSTGGARVAAGRAIRVQDNDAIVAVLQKYGAESPQVEADYELLYGEPFPEAANLPDFVVDREEERDNPQNEKFWEKEEQDQSPELDDDNYTPEVSIRPKFPLPRTFSPHNITIGLATFRNKELSTSSDELGAAIIPNGYTTYNGYVFRYAYTFRSHYWLKAKTPALLSAEFGFGLYNFQHTFPAALRPDPESSVAQVRVVPIHMGLRYLVEVSKLFRLYPYLGYQYNIVSAVDGSLTGLQPLQGGRLLGGAGGVLVLSNSVDARIEAGTDGVLGGLVVKF
jgi:hypothetical protein